MMSNNDIEIYEVEVDDLAQNEAKRLAKKKHFKALPKQVLELIEEFEKGNFSGDNILTYDEPTKIEVYKLRLPNPDANVGKSNGYRVIYVIAIEHKLVVILTIYYKKEKATISDSEIRGMINAFIAKYLPITDDID